MLTFMLPLTSFSSASSPLLCLALLLLFYLYLLLPLLPPLVLLLLFISSFFCFSQCFLGDAGGAGQVSHTAATELVLAESETSTPQPPRSPGRPPLSALQHECVLGRVLAQLNSLSFFVRFVVSFLASGLLWPAPRNSRRSGRKTAQREACERDKERLGESDSELVKWERRLSTSRQKQQSHT